MAAFSRPGRTELENTRMLDNEPTGGSELGVEPIADTPVNSDVVSRRSRTPRKRAVKALPADRVEQTEIPGTSDVAEEPIKQPTVRRTRKKAVAVPPAVSDP
ncbi:MAG: hypothetical protein H0T78_02460, partial [Longispora sp.]|nr:hypothetical protein [Longispora sp. (in: high G+C Gram-positive bacteria)]